MSRRRRKSPGDRLPRAEALARLRALLASVRADVEDRRTFSCAGCDAPCCRVGRNGMLVTPLEAEAAFERIVTDPDLHGRREEIARRLATTASRLLSLRTDPDEDPPTYDCPFLGEDARCLVHGPGQPLGCITFMPMTEDGCDQDVDVFEEAFEELQAILRAWSGCEDREGAPLPIAVDEMVRRSGPATMRRARGTSGDRE